MMRAMMATEIAAPGAYANRRPKSAWTTNDDTTAARIFAAGPASEMIAPSRRGFFRLYGSNWTGLPQPNRIRIRRIVPNGSRCARGLSVSLPCIRGVGSPRRSAVHAWENSWMSMANSNATMPKTNSSGLKGDPNIWYNYTENMY